MKKIIKALLAITIATFGACNDWFNVTAPSEIREEDHYKSVVGFQQTLIGCYIGMTDDNLYGKSLSWHLIERLGQQFQPVNYYSSTDLDYRAQEYSYKHANAISEFEGIWSKAYSVIVNANNALSYINKDPSLLDEINYQIIKGELLAIRAYLHFDILRLYGYGNWAERASELNAKNTIPYVKTLSKEVTGQLTGKETLKLILDDLEEAAALLKDYDPITGKHDAFYYAEVDIDGFFRNRTLHLNYYAVRGLQARVWLWEGSNDSKAKALAAAEEIMGMIENGGVKRDDIYTYLYLLHPDAISRSTSTLAVENLFGLNVPTLSRKIGSYIRPSYVDTDYAAMFLRPEDTNALYESNSSDVRFSQLLVQSTLSSDLGYVPLKVYQDFLTNDFYKNKVSMIRIPEIYYIAAECYATGPARDLEKAMELLNTIRTSRGIYDELTGLSAEEIMEEIKKEYRKEFLSEGVMFYYYKRMGEKRIPHYEGEMTDEQYVLPYPAFEFQAGRVQ